MIEFYKKHKSELPVYIILPTLIGALIQLIQLLRISPSYYSFFSITQCIVDGAFSLFQIISMMFVMYLLNKFVDEDEYDVFKEKIYLKGRSKQKARILFLRIFVIHFGYFNALLVWSDYIFDFSFPDWKTMLIMISSSIVFSLLVACKRTKVYLTFLRTLYEKREVPEFIKRDYLPINYVIGYSIAFIIIASYNYKLPEIQHNQLNFVNFLIKENNLEDAKILYFNDSYIITKLQKENCEWQNAVFKTDLLFSTKSLK